jgi:hypothetical protein
MKRKVGGGHGVVQQQNDINVFTDNLINNYLSSVETILERNLNCVTLGLDSS